MSEWCVESYPSSLYKFEIFSKLMFWAFCHQFWPWSGGSKSMPTTRVTTNNVSVDALKCSKLKSMLESYWHRRVPSYPDQVIKSQEEQFISHSHAQNARSCFLFSDPAPQIHQVFLKLVPLPAAHHAAVLGHVAEVRSQS